MNKINLYCWVSEFSNFDGEGNLARFFIKKILKKKFRIVLSTKKIKFIKQLLKYKYLSPFIGIIFCWYYYIKGKKVAYINFLPFWNIFIFILLPPKTILGPISGGALFQKKLNINYFIRKYFFLICYKISELFLFIRGKNFYFSTTLLKDYLNQTTIKNNNFNFVLKLINKKKKIRKNIDFLIYYRNHPNKESMFNYKLVQTLIKKGFSIYVVGKELNKVKSVKNLGTLSKKKLYLYLSKTKYSISSSENLYSLFNIDCINNNVKIFADKRLKRFVTKEKDNFIFIDFKKNIKI